MWLGPRRCRRRAGGGADLADNWPAVQARLRATHEEWSVILPMLQRISVLREDVNATAGAVAAGRRGVGGAFDSPMGGTSLDAPIMPNRGGGGAGSGPFDPKIAPGTEQRQSLLGALGGLMGRAIIGMVIPDQSHAMQTLLTELRGLAESREATDEQIREKLAAARAARNKAVRDLAAAQNDLEPFLTVDQLAILVSLGYLE